MSASSQDLSGCSFLKVSSVHTVTNGDYVQFTGLLCVDCKCSYTISVHMYMYVHEHEHIQYVYVYIYVHIFA